MGKIKAILALLAVLSPLALLAQDSSMLKIKPPIPDSNPAGINPGCNKCEWEIFSSSTQDTQDRRIKAMYLDGRFRLEIKSADGFQTQVMIFDNAELYILNPFFKTAALYYTTEDEAPMFLAGIFPGLGLKKKDRTVIGREKLYGVECDVISYRILKRTTDMFAWGTATEWLDKKTGRTLKVESITDEAQVPFNGKNITVRPVKQTYAAGRVENRFFMDKTFFKVPQSYRIVDMKKQYDEALEKQKGIKPGKGYEVRKITIPQGKGKQ